jgi:peptide/nickel transport system permease protein
LALLRYIVRRLITSLIVIVGVVGITFVITRVIPGDPAASWAGPRASPAQIAAARETLGLDKPVLVQFVDFLGGVLRGDWGTSIHTHRPVLDDLASAAPASLLLLVVAIVLGAGIGVVLGTLAARFRGSFLDGLVQVLSVFNVASPAFWAAIALQLVFSGLIPILPTSGDISSQYQYGGSTPLFAAIITGNGPMFADAAAHVVLPAVALSLYPMGVVARMVRSNILGMMYDPSIKMARSLGYGEGIIVTRFALRQRLGPVLHLIALVFAYSLVNAFLVESIFDWPGLGSYAAASISSLDTPAIAGVTLLIASVYVGANFLVDMIQVFLDPRQELR